MRATYGQCLFWKVVLYRIKICNLNFSIFFTTNRHIKYSRAFNKYLFVRYYIQQFLLSVVFIFNKYFFAHHQNMYCTTIYRHLKKLMIIIKFHTFFYCLLHKKHIRLDTVFFLFLNTKVNKLIFNIVGTVSVYNFNADGWDDEMCAGGRKVEEETINIFQCIHVL